MKVSAAKEKSKIFILYRWTNKINGKNYIGWTDRGIDKRWRSHLSSAKRGSELAFHRAIRKYGELSFVGEVIGRSLDESNIKKMEIEQIKEYKSFGPEGYNMTAGGDGSTGRIISETTRDKFRIANKKENNPNWGKVPSEETRALLIANHGGSMSGKKHSPASKLKMSISHKKLKRTEAHNKKIGNSNKGKHSNLLSEEHKSKISKSLIGNTRTKGLKMSQEQKDKISKGVIKASTEKKSNAQV